MTQFTFKLREQRQSVIDQALLDLDNLIPNLQQQRNLLANDPQHIPAELQQLDSQVAVANACQQSLKSEQGRLSKSDWTVADATYQWVFIDWIPQSQRSLRALVTNDPVLQFRGSEPKLTSAFEQEIANLNIQRTMTPSALLAQFLKAAGGDQAQVDEILQTAHRLWLANGLDQSPYDSICSLLPVRIETLFRNEAQGMELWLRITPDEPSISRHRPLVSTLEADFLQEFWTNVRKAIVDPAVPLTDWLATSKAATEWIIFCNRVGPARGTWLLTSFMPTIQNGDPQVQIPESNRGTLQQQTRQPDRVFALPTAIEVWVIYDDAGVEMRRRLDPVLQPENGVRKPEDLTLPLPDSSQSPTTILNHWLTDFDVAIKAGLGAKLPLAPAMTPESIKAIFVVGQSDESPHDLLHEHASAGTLGVLRLGSATNSVHAAPSVPLDKDPEVWWNVVHHRLGLGQGSERYDLQRSAFHRVSKVFLSDTSLPYCPLAAGDQLDPIDDVLESQRFVRALWPAMWGHFLRDHLQLLPSANLNANDFWRWSISNLWPEGPLPPVRIHDQPYGLLPVASLADWESDDSEDDRTKLLEPRLAKGLSRMLNALVQHAKPPTTVGADTLGLLNVIGRDAVTHKYLVRYWIRFEFFRKFFSGALLADGLEPDATWKGMFISPTGDRPPRLSSPHLALGWEYLDLPLIDATRRPLGLPLLDLLMELSRIDWGKFMQETMRRIVPDSLCIRLMMESMMLARAWQGQEKQNGIVQPLINPMEWQSEVSIKHTDRSPANQIGATSLDDLFQDMLVADKELGAFLDLKLFEEDDKFSEQGQRIWRMETPASRLAQLERAFRATLDTASYRIDPWITGLAWRRLENFNRSPRRLHTVGVYGWLDGPFRGSPGPTSAGLLHAPSQAQAITSIVLRDKFLSTQVVGAAAPESNTWEMNIESAVARKAMELAEECQLGFHLFQVIGHKVESILDDFEQIRTLRLLRPQYPDRPDVMAVCHGCHALESLLSEKVLAEPALDKIRVNLSNEKRKELELLNSSLDAYADLSVADAVHHLVTARTDHVAEAMDGASGFGKPPTLESIRTPPSGYRVHTTVVSAFRWVDAPTDPQQLPPSRIAEPSLATYLDSQFSQSDKYVWKVFQKTDANTPPNFLGSVSLAQLGLSLVDAALLQQVLLAQTVCAKLQLDKPFETLEVIAAPEYFVCRQLWGSLGQCPIGIDNLKTAKQLAQSGLESSTVQQTELSTERFDLLRKKLAKLSERAKNLANPNNFQVDDASSFLREIFCWGIVPGLSPQGHDALLRFVFAGVPALENDVQQWLTGASTAIEDRLKRTDDKPATRLNLLAKQIAELASSDGKLSILSKWTKADFLSATEILTGAPNATLDTQWLTVTACVRPALARIESLQLQAELQGTHQPLKSWTNGDPADPWKQKFIQPRILSKMLGQKDDFRLRESTPHLFASYGSDNTWDQPTLALGLIDEFGENIPVQERHTYAAWGFNAPAARSQQAILIAVPSTPRTPLTNAKLLQVLVETRYLTRARAVRPEDIQAPNGLLSSMWFQASGADRVRLGPDTQYWK